MTRASAFASLFIAAVAAATPTARAQETGPAPSADAMFEQASLAVAEGRFAAARDLLERVLALDPSPAAAFNLAIAYRGTGQLRRAVESFEALLGGRYGALDPVRERQVRALRREVEGDLGHLTIRLPAGIDGIELRVDGSAVEARGPAITLTVDPGSHIVSVTAPDHQAQDQQMDVAAGERVELRPQLVPRRDGRPGTLVVSSERPEQRIEIVGIASGHGRLERSLEAGTYQVRLVGDGGDERVATVRVPAGRTVGITLMSPQGPSMWESPWLWLTVGLLAAGAAAVATTAVLWDQTNAPLDFPPIPIVEALRFP